MYLPVGLRRVRRRHSKRYIISPIISTRTVRQSKFESFALGRCRQISPRSALSSKIPTQSEGSKFGIQPAAPRVGLLRTDDFAWQSNAPIMPAKPDFRSAKQAVHARSLPETRLSPCPVRTQPARALSPVEHVGHHGF